MQNKRQQKYLKRKIQNLLKQYRAQFLTLSFTDEILKTTNEKTRERYIKAFLKEESAIYILNKDYGSKNKREHYHAFIIPSTLKNDDFKGNLKDLKQFKNRFNYNAYKYGNIHGRFIATKYQYKGDKDYKLTAQKISEHFFKISTNESRIITSRIIPNKQSQIERIKRIKKIDDSKMSFITPKASATEEEIIKDALNDF